MKRRPLRVTIIGVLSIVAGLIYLFPALNILDLGNLISLSGQTFKSGPLVLTAVVVALANFILGIGCLIGWKPIWFYLVIISIVNFAIALLALLNANLSHWEAFLIPMAWLAIAIYVLLSVQSGKTRAWFHR